MSSEYSSDGKWQKKIIDDISLVPKKQAKQLQLTDSHY